MPAADGPDISSSGPNQRAFDWDLVGGCITKKFASARITHGPYTNPSTPVVPADWDPATNPPIIRPGFIDSVATSARDEMYRIGVERKCWYVIVTPLENALQARERVQYWVGLNGGLPPGECIAVDWESNPYKTDEIATPDQAWELWEALAAAYGPDRVGFYLSSSKMNDLRSWDVGFRWVAHWGGNGREVALSQLGCVLQWTSEFDCPAWGYRMDMNEVIDQARLDRACGIGADMPVQGVLDEANPTADGKVNVKGWAYDPDDPHSSISLRIAVGGADAGTVVTDIERADVNASLGITGNHGFDAVLTLPSVPVTLLSDAGAGIGARSLMVWAVPPPVGPPPIDPTPPDGGVTDEHIADVARGVAREEIGKAHLSPG